MMKQEFDFDRIGKRMPYTVPHGFFEKMEKETWQAIQEETKMPSSAKRKPKQRAIRLAAGIAAAACIALCLALPPLFKTDAGGEWAKVEQAFDKLSAEDQAFLWEVFQDDIFINE